MQGQAAQTQSELAYDLLNAPPCFRVLGEGLGAEGPPAWYTFLASALVGLGDTRTMVEPLVAACP